MKRTIKAKRIRGVMATDNAATDYRRSPDRHRSLPGRSLNQRGISLVEVLVTVLILGVGLLGLAAMQVQSMRFNQDSYLRSQATVLADTLIDMMRLRRTTLAAGYAAAPTAGACDPFDASVAAEVRCWHAEVAARLPGGTGTVTQDAVILNRFTITVAWLDREPREFSSGTSPRVPATENDCLYPDGDTSATARSARAWDATGSRCLIAQAWAVEVE